LVLKIFTATTAHGDGYGQQAWDQFEEWVDVVVEAVPLHKKAAQRKLTNTKVKLKK
jgi:hypothetical protein